VARNRFAKTAKLLALALLLIVVSGAALVTAAAKTGEACGADADCNSKLCVQGYCSAVPSRSWALGDWVPMAGLSVLIAYLIVAFAYMIGIGFQYKDVTTWANSEFWEATLSAAMVGLCITLVLMISDVSTILTGSTNHIAEGMKYLDKAGGDLRNDWAGLLALNAGLSIPASFWLRFNIPIPLIPSPGPTTVIYLRTGATLAFLAGWQQIVSGFGPLIYMIAISMFSMSTQKALLIFAGNNMLSVFVPLGIIARGFPLTRKMGGTMIAMALALYFVFPLTLVMNGEIYDLYHGSDPKGTIKEPSVPFLGGGGTSIIIDLLRPLVRTAVCVTILFILDMIIVMTSFRAIAVSIGGDPNIFGLGKLGV